MKESKRWNLETLLYVSVFKGEAYKVIEHDINKDKRCDHKTTKGGKPSYAVIFWWTPLKTGGFFAKI